MIKTPVAVPVSYDNTFAEPVPFNKPPVITNAVLVPGSNRTVPVAIPEEEPIYDTGHRFMDLQDEYDFGDEDEDKPPLEEEDDETNTSIRLCLCRIRQDYSSPFLEFLVEKTDDTPLYHLPVYTVEPEDREQNSGPTLQNNLLRKIEILLNTVDTLETPRFLGFQQGFAYFDLSRYSASSSQNSSVQWVLLNQMTEANGFHPDTLAFFQQHISIRTLYHLPTQEEVPPPVLVYHSFATPTRVDDPIFGSPFVYTEKPLSAVATQEPVSDQETIPVEQRGGAGSQTSSMFSGLNFMQTTPSAVSGGKSYPFILFPPPLEKTFVILKQEFQHISPDLLKRYGDVFLKKSCIRFLKNGIDYWIVKSPVAAFPYTPFVGATTTQKTPVIPAAASLSSKVSFLPEKNTTSFLTRPSSAFVQQKINTPPPNSFHLNLENLLNPHRITERADMLRRRRLPPRSATILQQRV